MNKHIKTLARIAMFCIIVIYLSAIIISYSTTLISEDSRALYQDYLYLISIFASVSIGSYALLKYGLKRKFGFSFLFLLLGFIFLFISELYWVVLYNSGLEVIQSIMVNINLIANIFFIAGLIYGQKEGEIEWVPLNLLFSLFIMFAISIFTFYLSVTYWYNPAAEVSENVFNIIYGVLSCFSVISVSMLVNLSASDKDKFFIRLWKLFALCFSLLWIGDSLYTIFHKYYDAGMWFYRQMDYFWIAGYLISAYVFFLVAKKADEKISTDETKKGD
jgi:hypothetical protein